MSVPDEEFIETFQVLTRRAGRRFVDGELARIADAVQDGTQRIAIMNHGSAILNGFYLEGVRAVDDPDADATSVVEALSKYLIAISELGGK